LPQECIKELVSGQRRSLLQTKFQYGLEKINQSNSPGVDSTNANSNPDFGIEFMASIAAGLFFRIIGPFKYKNQCIYEPDTLVYFRLSK
jgi:hypothetical protein